MLSYSRGQAGPGYLRARPAAPPPPGPVPVSWEAASRSVSASQFSLASSSFPGGGQLQCRVPASGGPGTPHRGLDLEQP